MTEPQAFAELPPEREPDPDDPHAADFEDPEDFAEAVGPDPTPQQVDEYRQQFGKGPTQEPPD
ncbi:hypothetical protein [Crossiella sp. NPDC003009]